MKLPHLRISALQTVTLGGFGGLVAASGFLAPVHRSNHPSPAWLLVVMLVLIILGFALSIYADAELRKGITEQRWPADEIASTRAVLASSFWTASILLCLIPSIVLLFVSRHYRPIGWALMVFGQTLSRAQIAVRPPRPPSSPSTGKPFWSNFAPIRSNHWGER